MIGASVRVTRQITRQPPGFAPIFAVPGTLGGYWSLTPDRLFSDSSATTPAAVGSPVGCVLDISTDAALPTRRNLLINSEVNAGLASFTTISSTGITLTTLEGFDSAIEVARDPNQNVFAYNLSAGASVIGTTYAVSCYVSMNDGLNPNVISAVNRDFALRISGSVVAVTDVFEAGPNLYRVSGSFVATTTSSQMGLIKLSTYSARSFKASGFQVEIGPAPTIYQKIITGTADLIPGNHAFQQTTANMPYLRQTPETGVLWLDSNTSTCALVATFAESLGSNCTIVRAGAEGAWVQTGVTITTTHNIAPPYGFNGEVMIVNRALTASELALVTRYMSRRVPTLGAEKIPNNDFNEQGAWSLFFGAQISGGNLVFDGTTIVSGILAEIPYSAPPGVYWIKSVTTGAHGSGGTSPGLSGVSTTLWPLSIVGGAGVYAQIVSTPSTSTAFQIRQRNTVGPRSNGYASVSMKEIL